MIWRFRDFELDDVRFELRRGGERVAIPPKPLALLLHLAKRHPASVSRRELFRVLWPEVRVTSSSVARAVAAARRALGEDGYGEAVIRTIRGRGYAFRDSSAPEPLGVMAAGAPLDAPFVGRVTELACVESCLDHIDDGHGRLLFITGEPGIGKSRMLDELASRALARRALVVAGRCNDDDGAPPYWPWPEVLRGLATQSKDPSLHAAWKDLMLDMAPRQSRDPHGDHPHRPLTDVDARFRLFHTVTDVLRQAARGRALIVLLEDLHWAGPGALHLLRFAGRSLSNVSILIAATYRNSGAPLHAVLEATIGELTALSHAAPMLPLSGFSPDEIAAYVHNVTGSPPHADLIRRLQDAAGGNPLFLRELIPMLACANAGGESRERMSVPSSITHILRTQIGVLPQPARELVELASVVGREFSPHMLARACGRRLDTVLEHLEGARAQNLIVRDRSGCFRFRHDIIRTALYDGLGPARRVALHGRVARAIEAGGDPEAHLAELAHHFSAALLRAGPEKAVAYAARAAETARSALDFDDAVMHYRQALGALGERRSAVTRCDLLLGLGEVLELTGQLAQSREAILAAAQLARRLRSFPRLGRAALAITAWQPVVLADPVAVDLVEGALRAIGRRRVPLRARLLAKLAVLRRAEGDEAEAARFLDEALALAKRLRDLPLHCDLLVHQLQVMQYGIPGDHAARLTFTAELLNVAERAESPYAILQCRRHRVALLLEAGAGPELDEEIAHFARESAAARCKHHYVAAFRAMRAIVCGRFEEARRAIEEVETLADPFSAEERRFTPTSQRLQLAPMYRDGEALARSIQDIVRDYPHVVPWRIASSLVALDQGSTEEARSALEQAAIDDFALVPRNVSYVVALACLARISWQLGEPRYARRLRDLLLPHIGQQVTTGLGMGYEGPVDWHLGVLAAMLGRRREAARHFGVALATTKRLGALPWHARTEVTYASLLADGSPDERTRARPLAISAAAAATRFGMHAVRAEAEMVMAKLGRTKARLTG